MRTRALPALLCLTLLGVLAAAPAQAQLAETPSDETKEAAKAAADRGQALFDAGKYDEASAAFRDADQKFPAPTIKLMLARSLARLGRLREARVVYQQIVDEKLVHYAPRVFFEAQGEARKELEALIPRIPSLRVSVSGAPAREVHLTVDGQPATPGQMLPQDPGEHSVTASAPARAPITQQVVLQEGAAAQVSLELKRVPAPPAPTSARPAAAGAQPPSAAAPGAEGGRGYVGPAIAAFGVGGAALLLGAITGGMSLARTGEVEEECLGGACYDDSGGDAYDGAQTLATVSNVSFVVGAMSAAVGITLLVWPREEQGGAQVGMVVRPGWLGVQGGF